jgi:hypothetical protein
MSKRVAGTRKEVEAATYKTMQTVFTIRFYRKA